MASVPITDQSGWNAALDAGKGGGENHPLQILDRSDRALRKGYEQLRGARPGAGVDVPVPLLVDHYPYLRSQIRELRESLSRDYCRKLIDAPGAIQSSPRVYRLCRDAVIRSRGHLDTEGLAVFFRSIDFETPLSLAELWAIPLMLKLALVDGVAQVAAIEPLDLGPLDQEVVVTSAQCRHLEKIRWRDLIESISGLHRAMSQDPSGIYPAMDFDTRNAYLHSLEQMAAHNATSETHVARLAVKLAGEAASRSDDPRKTHVGYYLLGRGIAHLRRRARLRVPFAAQIRELATLHSNTVYLGSIALWTVALTYLSHRLVPLPWWLMALLVVPLSQTALSLTNLAINLFLPPRRLPSLDFSRGIPDEYRTFVVVPTLLLSASTVQKMLERLEIHYLANRDPNLSFALLTDLADSNAAYADDQTLVDLCVHGIRRLNKKHAGFGKAPFYLFHRPRLWNAGQCVWMGRERKRGKLEDFNRLLLGQDDAFALKEGDLSLLGSIRYVITLDSDTQLPRDAARKLVGTLAHPLNRAVLDPKTKVVRKGYGILQPRVSISLESTSKSRLARLYGGQAGLDPYTTAVSDVYQDLYGRATYSGKGIYDVRAFQEAAEERFPDNTLLSHDLIEGEYAGVGLASTIEVIDDYPTTYESFSKRKHRWIRGDWQILYWLFPRVPRQDGRWERNALPLHSRWKIFDNLRRSLFEATLFSFLLGAWMFSPQPALKIAAIAVTTLLLPVLVQTAISLLRLPPARFWRGYFHETAIGLFRSSVEILLTFTFLLHQAALSIDAIVRTLIRRFITRKKLLEWECMAQSEERSRSGFDLIGAYLWAGVPVAFALAVSLHGRGIAAVGLIVLWIAAPLVAAFINQPPSPPRAERGSDREFLRKAALLTWRYFADLSRPDDHWLVPDNIQEDPHALARRTSPTNIGLQLTATLAAFDFGYLTLSELNAKLGGLFETLDRLERSGGHFYNWYDTDTLNPIPPRFVSTVDSGNLCAALIALKQGCEALPKQPIAGPDLLEGLRDHCLQLRASLPFSVKSAGFMRLLAALIRQLECRPTDMFFWASLLRDVKSMTRQLERHVEWACECTGRMNPAAAREIEYWYAALNTRVTRALETVTELAPWLCSPFEEKLRVRALTPGFADLTASISRVPSLEDLPSTYDRVQSALSQLLKQCQPLSPAFHDSLLMLVYQVESARIRSRKMCADLQHLTHSASALAVATDFSFLLDERQNLMSIGYDADTGTLADSYYDLLASEARTAVFLAIAKGDAPCEAWFRLGRQVATFRGWKTLVSWSGTMFEYLMPSLFMKTFHRTLLHQSLKAVVKIQHAYGRESGVPWGISESAYAARDSAQNYQYRAFGVPVIKLDGAASGRLVIAPYASMLALMVERPAAVENLKAMVSRGWIGRFGFFEAIEFSERSRGRRKATVVRSFMAHHQGMSLLSLCNVVLGNRMQKRFHADPMVAATELMLQERVPVAEEPLDLAIQEVPPVEPLAA